MSALATPIVGIRRRRPLVSRPFSANAGGGAATAYTLTGPTTGLVGSATTNYTVQSNGTLAAPVTVTPSDNGKLGSFSPSSVTLAAGTNTSATFTYTPLYYGTISISTTNNGGLTDPAPISFTSTLPAGGGSTYRKPRLSRSRN